MQIHGFLIKNGLYPSDHFVKAGMLKLYLRDPRVAQDLFDEMPKVDPVHYDILMSSYLQAGLAPNALSVFNKILVSDVEPDCFVLTTALTASAQAGALDQGVQIHRYLERRNRDYLKDMFIGSSLIHMYSKCGCIDEAKQVFVEMPKRNIRVRSVMISAFAMHGLAAEAVGCLTEMQEKNDLNPDSVILLGVLTACAHSGLVRDGLKIFSEMEVKYKVTPQHEHYSCVVDMLCRVGWLHEALGLIHEMPMKPMVPVWGAFITGCRLHKNVELAEIAAKQMQGLTGGVFENGNDEGVFVQLYNIYLHAGLKDDARKVRRLIGTKGIKKAPAVSEITVDGVTSSFVAGDYSHQSQVEIWGILDILVYHMGKKEKCVEDILLDTDEYFCL